MISRLERTELHGKPRDKCKFEGPRGKASCSSSWQDITLQSQSTLDFPKTQVLSLATIPGIMPVQSHFFLLSLRVKKQCYKKKWEQRRNKNKAKRGDELGNYIGDQTIDSRKTNNNKLHLYKTKYLSHYLIRSDVPTLWGRLGSVIPKILGMGKLRPEMSRVSQCKLNYIYLIPSRFY